MKKFKDFNDYKAQRDALINEASGLLSDGKMEEYQAKVKDIEEMDAEYEEFAKEQANLSALKGAVKPPSNMLGNSTVSVHENEDAEYRKAFMNYVLKGMPIAMSNADANTAASDVGAVIPNTILNRIVEKMERHGNILAKVTKTYYKGGVTVPTASAKPTATWTTESGTTDKQKKAVGSISFTYYKLKIQISMSIIVDNVTMDIFEQTLASNIADAMVKAIEAAIINGTGSGQPKGILAETAPEGQNVDIPASASLTYALICEAEGKIPSAYDDARWIMNKKTYMSQVAGMVDSSGQPIARTNSGIDRKPEYTILGRPVEFSEDIPAYAATVSKDTVVACIFRLEDYMLNTNMGITVSRYTDQDTDDEITKAIMLADGKVIDKNSLVTVTKKA